MGVHVHVYRDVYGFNTRNRLVDVKCDQVHCRLPSLNAQLRILAMHMHPWSAAIHASDTVPTAYTVM